MDVTPGVPTPAYAVVRPDGSIPCFWVHRDEAHVRELARRLGEGYEITPVVVTVVRRALGDATPT